MGLNNINETASFRSPFRNGACGKNIRSGQTLVEYALILAIISIVAVSVMINLGKQVSGVYSMVTSQVAAAQSSH
jgi:Flp pilus assembly pilin Flp